MNVLPVCFSFMEAQGSAGTQDSECVTLPCDGLFFWVSPFRRARWVDRRDGKASAPRVPHRSQT